MVSATDTILQSGFVFFTTVYIDEFFSKLSVISVVVLKAVILGSVLRCKIYRKR